MLYFPCMKYLLTSSGITNNTLATALSEMLGKPLEESSVLFVPTAANTEGGDKRWLIRNLKDFEKYNVASIDILDAAAVSKDVFVARCREKDVICIGGGNEKYLAEVFSDMGMREVLTSFSDDKVYVGISAGSMVTGKFMADELYPVIFPEEDFGVASSDPMSIHDFCFIPHLNSNFFSHVRKEVLESVEDTFVGKVYATDDETAVKVEGDKVEIVGEGESWVRG